MTKMILGICRNPAQRQHSQGTNWLLAQAKQIPHLEASSKARPTPCWRHSHQSATTFDCSQTSSGSLGRSRAWSKRSQHKPKPAFKSKFSLPRWLGCKQMHKQMLAKWHEEESATHQCETPRAQGDAPKMPTPLPPAFAEVTHGQRAA